MQATTGLSVRRIISRFRRICKEMDYAQKRLFEIQTGIVVLPPSERPQVIASIDQLEALYALPAVERTKSDA